MNVKLFLFYIKKNPIFIFNSYSVRYNPERYSIIGFHNNNVLKIPIKELYKESKQYIIERLYYER